MKVAASGGVVTAAEAGAVALIADWAIVAAIRIMTTVKGKGMTAVIVVEGVTRGNLCGK